MKEVMEVDMVAKEAYIGGYEGDYGGDYRGVVYGYEGGGYGCEADYGDNCEAAYGQDMVMEQELDA